MYEGLDIKMKCPSILQPKWIKDGRPLLNHIVTGDVLSLKDAKMSDSGRYQCIGTYDSTSNTFKAVAEVSVGGNL